MARPALGAGGRVRGRDRVLDELVERGHDCLRIDAFPPLVAAEAEPESDGFTLLPQPARYVWANHRAVDVRPRAALTSFLASDERNPAGSAARLARPLA